MACDCCFRAALALRKEGQKTDCGLNGFSLWVRRNCSGWLHPETAESLALAGDLEAEAEGYSSGMPFWVLALGALEALAAVGERGGLGVLGERGALGERGKVFERSRAALELRLGLGLMEESAHGEAILLMETAMSRAVALLGEMDVLALEALLALARARALADLRVACGGGPEENRGDPGGLPPRPWVPSSRGRRA
ncbi:MAG: hypothetical protein LBQ12_03505 [Deltaproteobacteria bacterium]|jgi:hypothetical protein|nr:hypothetical protein [Deltaproteobacteria bacterium]